MRVTASDYYIPTGKITFQQTLDLFRTSSRLYHSEETLNEILALVAKLLDRSGFKQCVIRGEKEDFYRNYIDLVRKTIHQNGLTLKDIDTVVYYGVGRGYREPATAYQMAAALGIENAVCFDVLDACNGWGRAAALLDPHFRNGTTRHALLLSLEFNRPPYLTVREGHNVIYSLRDPQEMEWRTWAATVGEAGSVTILSRDVEHEPWYFDYVSATSAHKECSFTMTNHRDYDHEPMPLDTLYGGHEIFYAYGKKIGDIIKDLLLPLLNKVPHYLKESKVVIPHSLSFGVYDWIFRSVGVEDKAVHPFNDFGNCVSCGVPMGLGMAIKEGRIRRGDRVLMAPTGSGISAGVISFIY